MWMELGRGAARKSWASKAILLCCAALCFLTICALLTGIGSANVCSGISRADSDSHLKGGAATGAARNSSGGCAQKKRRRLGGPGSYPPRCAGKCGRCTPCRPVHVPVPPGTPVTTEYYPEAWRCKCRNQLYMP